MVEKVYGKQIVWKVSYQVTSSDKRKLWRKKVNLHLSHWQIEERRWNERQSCFLKEGAEMAQMQQEQHHSGGGGGGLERRVEPVVGQCPFFPCCSSAHTLIWWILFPFCTHYPSNLVFGAALIPWGSGFKDVSSLYQVPGTVLSKSQESEIG